MPSSPPHRTSRMSQTDSMVRPVAGSEDEIDARLRHLSEHGRWSRMTGPTEDGRKVLMATNLINAPPTDIGRTVALFDLHPRLSTWALTARWRTEELVSESVSCLAAWHLVAAAATARALNFRSVLDAPLMQAQYARRSHDESKIEDQELARRSNVGTF